MVMVAFYPHPYKSKNHTYEPVRAFTLIWPSCQARGSLIYGNKVNRVLKNIRRNPLFWSCTFRGSGVALPHIHLQRYYPSISTNHVSLLVFEYEATWYRMNPVHWQDMDFRKLFFVKEGNVKKLNSSHFSWCFTNPCFPLLNMKLLFLAPRKAQLDANIVSLFQLYNK